MNDTKPIDVEAVKVPADQQPQMALAKVESGALGRAMTIEELHENLEFIRNVMKKEMKEGQDYGKIPGVDRDCLFQPGAQKLLMVFNLTESVKRETLREFPGMPLHREYELTMTVAAPNGKTWDGVGTCSTLESKYRYRKAERKCPECGLNKIIAGKAEWGGGFICFKKKGGCGAKFTDQDQRITSQAAGTVEFENPPDYWNTVRKMAFKRALVHASINATNTSELWTQDVEEMKQNEEMSPKGDPRNAPVDPGRTKTSRPAQPSPPLLKASASRQPRAWRPHRRQSLSLKSRNTPVRKPASG